MFAFIRSALLAACITAPSMAAEVNVYSYRQPELVEPLFSAFTADTGIDVNVVFISKGLIERLQAEGDRSPADLVMTTDIARLSQLASAGVTQAVTDKSVTANIPAEFRDPEGHWFGLTTRARVIYASKDRVAEGEPIYYEDLTDPKWKGRICTRSGTHSYNLGLISAFISHKGTDATQAWLEGLKANLARKPQGNERAQVKAIWSGECDISLGNTYYMGLMMDNPDQKPWADAVRIIFPTFSDGGTHVNISGMAMTKSAPNRDNALKLMAFLASPTGQSIYAQTNDEYPLAPGTEVSDRVKAWGEFNADTVSLAEVAKLRAQALRLVETVNFDN